jgi:hypothetical protein
MAGQFESFEDILAQERAAIRAQEAAEEERRLQAEEQQRLAAEAEAARKEYVERINKVLADNAALTAGAAVVANVRADAHMERGWGVVKLFTSREFGWCISRMVETTMMDMGERRQDEEYTSRHTILLGKDGKLYEKGRPMYGRESGAYRKSNADFIGPAQEWFSPKDIKEARVETSEEFTHVRRSLARFALAHDLNIKSPTKE